MSNPPDILVSIVENKRSEVESAKSRVSESALIGRIEQQPSARGFADAIRRKTSKGIPAVIAECKKASPSKGVIRPDYDVETLCSSYENGGAACLSVLSDERYFQGSLSDLWTTSQHSSLPVLRKDFIVDSYQVYEARAYGADCILLIVSVLAKSEMRELGELARQLGMDVLIEVHTERELDIALDLRFELIGINNRNLHTFEIALETSLTLGQRVPSDRIVVAESGIHTRTDVQRLREAQINAFLVGEAFMKSPDPGSALKDLFQLKSSDLTEVA